MIATASDCSYTASDCLHRARAALGRKQWEEAKQWARRGLAPGARCFKGSADRVAMSMVTALDHQVRVAVPPKTFCSSRPVLLMVGGIGRMEATYREVCASTAWDLVFVESGPRLVRGQPAAVFVVVSVVSHPIREHAAELAKNLGVPIKYLRKPSVAALRRALQELTGANP